MLELSLRSIATLIEQTVWFAPILALVAGVFTSMTPCALTSVALIIGYVRSTEETQPRQAFLYAVLFAVGSSITFVGLGLLASSAGMMMGMVSSRWYLFLGTLMTLLALQIWGVVSLIPSTNFLARHRKRGLWGALIAGVIGGLFSSPCSTPVLIALLGLVAQEGKVGFGVFLMLCYALGHSVLVLIAGTSIGWVQKMSQSSLYGFSTQIIQWFFGGLIFFMGLYFFWLGF